MTTKQAVRILPRFAAGLYDPLGHETVADLRFAVQFELDSYYEGENPLTDKQVSALRKFMAKTGGGELD